LIASTSSHDLARARSDQGGAISTPALAVADQLECAPVEVVDVAARVSAGSALATTTSDASCARGSRP